MLDENTTQPSNDVQTEQTTVSDDAADYKQLYLDEVQNAKKLRKRAQESEIQNQEFLKTQETAKVRSLKEQEKFKELSENLQSQLDTVSPYKERWESYESNRKDSLLAKLPEADRERMSNKDIDTLEYIVSKINEVKPDNLTPSPGSSRNIGNKTKDWMKMGQDEKRENWGNIVDMYTKKK